LKDMPEGRHPIKYGDDYISTLLPHVFDARSVCELLQWDAAWRVYVGDADGALESCLALENAARSMGDEPFLISLLVRYACNAVAMGAIERTLAQGHFTPASVPNLKRLQELLAKELSEAKLVNALRGERAGMHQLVQALEEGKVNPAVYKALATPLQLVIAVTGSKAGTSVTNDINVAMMERFPGLLSLQHAALLRYFNELVDAAKLPPPEWEQRFQDLESKIPNQPFLVRALVPAFLKVREAERRTYANLRCAMAALAAERYRLAHDRWPDSIEELVKTGFLVGAPIDPYDGKTIRLKRAADGLIVYSVGLDKIDNDGFINRDNPSAPGTDLGFRLWDVSRRRQPPNPPVQEENAPR
jgi:hypothetical protein